MVKATWLTARWFKVTFAIFLVIIIGLFVYMAFIPTSHPGPLPQGSLLEYGLMIVRKPNIFLTFRTPAVQEVEFTFVSNSLSLLYVTPTYEWPQHEQGDDELVPDLSTAPVGEVAWSFKISPGTRSSVR